MTAPGQGLTPLLDGSPRLIRRLRQVTSDRDSLGFSFSGSQVVEPLGFTGLAWFLLSAPGIGRSPVAGLLVAGAESVAGVTPCNRGAFVSSQSRGERYV